MDLNKFANKIVAENQFIKASFGGFAGSGKTRTATEFIIGAYKALGLTKPILFIDNEKGSRFLIPMFKNAGIETYVKETVNVFDVIQAFDMMKTKQIDFLFIDSLTKVWYQYVRDYKTKANKVFMTLQDWGKILPAWQETFADKYVDLNGCCVFTGRGGYTYDVEENDETKKKEFVKSGVKMKMAGETPFEPDLNIWMEIQQDINKETGSPVVWREALVMKDRSSLIDGKTFKNPTYKDFAPVVEYLIATEKGEVKKSENAENIAPQENYDYQNRKEQKEIELEKIKNSWIENNIGSQGKEDKQTMIAMMSKFFGTNSWTEIEKMSLETLQCGRHNMDEMFKSWSTLNDLKERLDFIKGYENKDDAFFKSLDKK